MGIEDRIAQLETEVAELKRKLASQQSESADTPTPPRQLITEPAPVPYPPHRGIGGDLADVLGFPKEGR
jgi:hypothetical protein